MQVYAYLWRVLEVEGVVETEVYEPQESGVELHERQHDTEINISWHLHPKQRKQVKMKGRGLQLREMQAPPPPPQSNDDNNK